MPATVLQLVDQFLTVGEFPQNFSGPPLLPAAVASLTCALLTHKTSAVRATRHGSQQRRSPGFQSTTSDWWGWGVGGGGEWFPPAWVPTRTGISIHHLRLKGGGGGGGGGVGTT